MFLADLREKRNSPMLGIEQIGSYIPADRLSNYARKTQFDIDDHFIEEKIGVRSVSRKATEEETSDLCLKAFADLAAKSGLSPNELQALVVVTQTPDFQIPHTSAVVHGRLGLPQSCACFDISLGCSGFVYGLSVITAFMAANGLSKGVLITADPYSKVVDRDDKNAALFLDRWSKHVKADRDDYLIRDRADSEPPPRQNGARVRSLADDCIYLADDLGQGSALTWINAELALALKERGVCSVICDLRALPATRNFVAPGGACKQPQDRSGAAPPQ